MHTGACASLLRDVNASACAIRDHVIVDVYNCMRVCICAFRYVHACGGWVYAHTDVLEQASIHVSVCAMCMHV